MSIRIIRLATRRSPLALRQTQMALQFMRGVSPDAQFESVEFETSGDKKLAWSLEKEGGKGLFTKELEDALLDGRADMAVHSAKDLPTENPEGLALAGFLPRAPANDVLVVREGVTDIRSIATGSPRRREQAKRFFPDVEWRELRGNVHTRLKKIAGGDADATFMAQAGLQRLGIFGFEGLAFRPLTTDAMVPAAGQGAIALQCRLEEVETYAAFLDQATKLNVEAERRFLAGMGGGCHSAMGAFAADGEIRVFHSEKGTARFPLEQLDERIRAWCR